MPKIFPHMIFRQCFNRTHDLIFWPLSFINKLATINRYNDEFRSDSFPYTPSILPTWRVAEWWIYTCPTDDLLPYRKSYADVGPGDVNTCYNCGKTIVLHLLNVNTPLDVDTCYCEHNCWSHFFEKKSSGWRTSTNVNTISRSLVYLLHYEKKKLWDEYTS